MADTDVTLTPGPTMTLFVDTANAAWLRNPANVEVGGVAPGTPDHKQQWLSALGKTKNQS